MSPDFLTQLQSALGTAYSVERELGGGGMSRVYVATESALGRRVVVKVLPPELSAEVSSERFRREIQVAAQLQNPHIVPLLSAGEAAGLLYYTMPYVDGESLRARLARDGELPVSVAVTIMRDVAKALAYAHRRAVVHRDIKPENILLSEGDALVADFGVAKALSASTAQGSGITSVGMAIGTPAYMAPEQAMGEAGVDARADLYALGVVAYEMLTGSAVFPGRTPQAMIAAHMTEEPEAIGRRRANLPPTLAALVMRLLAKRPADRPQSADDVLRELDTITISGITAASMTTAAVPSTTRSRRTLIVAAVAAAVAIGAVLMTRARTLHAPGVTAAAAEQSIAVLPFVNMSGDKDNEFFSDGLTEELTDRLANVHGLRVASRTSSFAFKNKDVDVREIGRALGVHSIVEGSVRREGSQVRVTAQLIDADSGYHRWSNTYDGDLKDVFAVQEQIGTAISSALRIALGARDSSALARAPTSDTLAHNLYLQARFQWAHRSGSSLDSAITLFKHAIARDSAYADAWGGLASVYAILPFYKVVKPKEAFATSLAMADRALALDSMLASARAARAISLGSLYRWAEADEEFKRALALNPNDATTHQWYAVTLLSHGEDSTGLVEGARAIQLDPLSVIIRLDHAFGLYAVHRYAEAEAMTRQAMVLDSSFAFAGAMLASVLLVTHQPDSAVAAISRTIALEGEPHSAQYLAQLGYALALDGKPDSARAILRTMQQRAAREYYPAYAIATVQLGLGDKDGTFASLEKAVDDHDYGIVPGGGFPEDPVFDPLRTDRRWSALLQRARVK